MLDGISLAEYARQWQAREQVLAQAQVHYSGRVRLLSPRTHLCDDDSCLYQVDGFPLYFDTHHLTRHGAERLQPMFDAYFREFRDRY